MSKLIVFDVDGTFLDSHGLFEKVVLEYSRAQGLPEPCLKTIRHGYGDPHAHDFRWGVSREEQVKHLFAAYIINDDITMRGDPNYTPDLFDGVPESLAKLKDDGHTLAVITSKAEAPLLHLLDMHNIKKFFSTHRAYDDIQRRREREKPAPDMLHSVMLELGFIPEDTVMVGDTSMDIRMGNSAGVPARQTVTALR